MLAILPALGDCILALLPAHTFLKRKMLAILDHMGGIKCSSYQLTNNNTDVRNKRMYKENPNE
jgi:hypothetical protein